MEIEAGSDTLNSIKELLQSCNIDSVKVKSGKIIVKSCDDLPYLEIKNKDGNLHKYVFFDKTGVVVSPVLYANLKASLNMDKETTSFEISFSNEEITKITTTYAIPNNSLSILNTWSLAEFVDKDLEVVV